MPDGSAVALGCALEPAIPFAAAHELIRQSKRELRLIGPISDIAFDMLIGAGCVAEVDAAWVGNVSAGLAHCYRRAMEQGVPRRITVRDHSNFTMALSLLAGALGAPYIPTNTLLRSDIPRVNGTFNLRDLRAPQLQLTLDSDRSVVPVFSGFGPVVAHENFCVHRSAPPCL